MTRTVAYCAIICASTIVIIISVFNPSLLSDNNPFLKSFVGHEILAVLGVILAITLASAAQLHLSLNAIEERVGSEGLFTRTRMGIRSAVYWLIGLFLIAVLLVVAKPLVAVSAESQSLANGAAIIILLWNSLILISISQAVFGVAPVIGED